MARKKKKKKRISIAEQNQIIKMRDSGMSFHAIARKLIATRRACFESVTASAVTSAGHTPWNRGGVKAVAA